MRAENGELANWGWQVVALGLLLVLAACGDDPKATLEYGELNFGSVCERNSDCASGACIRVSESRSVCVGSCESDEVCPVGPNWACVPANEVDVKFCACQSNADEELCGDGIDNDCDGLVDDCFVCAGRLIAPGDVDNCGGCGIRCADGAACRYGVCECEEGTEGCTLDPSAPECDDAADCDDDIPCTEDVCSTGRCVNTVVPARCGAGEVCDLRKNGCVPGKPCADDSDCRDDDPCTTEVVCDPASRVCLWTPLDGDGDGQPPRVCGGTDCDDSDGLTFTGAVELCDGIDNSCDGLVDVPLAENACGENQACEVGRCECTGDLTMCFGRCVDTDKDALNCGGCGAPCGANETCAGGTCECGEGFTDCGTSCTDTAADLNHCGACGQPCAFGEVCEESVCVNFDDCAASPCNADSEDCVDELGGFSCVCKPGFVASGGTCVDVNECLAANDCAAGACSNTPGGYECICPKGFTGDGKVCDDIDECADDPCDDHGTCQNKPGYYQCVCDPGYSVDDTDINVCMLVNACEAGLLEPEQKFCGGACRTLATDDNHCGDCGNSCLGGTCVGGGCTCSAASETFCAGSGCVDVTDNFANCGRCGKACPTGGSCVGGTCYCPSGQTDCNGVCVQLGTTLNCARCGDSCAQGASCASGTCTCPANSPDICNNLCVSKQTDEVNCGTCGRQCASGATCNAGTCECPSGQSECSGQCLDLTRSASACGDCQTTCNVLCRNSGCLEVTQVAAGGVMTLALLDDGRVLSWGYDYYGSLGDGAGNSSGATPRLVSGLSNVVKVAAGNLHGCALTSAGDVSCWGSNASQQITTSSQGSVINLPYTVRASGVSDIVLGQSHTCLVLTDGSIECRGALTVRGDGGVATSLDSWSGPSSLSNVTQLVSGNNHVCALKDKKVYCWGDNSSGQLGQGNSGSGTNLNAPAEVVGLTDVDVIAAGGNTSCAISAGKVRCWGYNGYREASNVTTTSIAAFASSVSGLNSDALEVWTSTYRSCAKLTSGELMCWGNATNGRLGNGAASGTFGPTLVDTTEDLDAVGLGSGGHSCALNGLGQVFCWGDASNYAAGSNVSVTRPMQITNFNGVP